MMESLPPEVLLKIFIHLDGISLFRLKQVCRKFNTICDEFSKDYLNPWWKRRTFAEFEESCGDVQKSLGLSYYQSEISWRNVYINMIRWNSIRSWTPKVDLVHEHTEDLKSIHLAVCGPYIISGTAHDLFVYNGLEGSPVENYGVIVNAVFIDWVSTRIDDNCYIFGLATDDSIYMHRLCSSAVNFYQQKRVATHVSALGIDHIACYKNLLLGWRQNGGVVIKYCQVSPKGLSKWSNFTEKICSPGGLGRITSLSVKDNLIRCVNGRGIYLEYNIQDKQWNQYHLHNSIREVYFWSPNVTFMLHGVQPDVIIYASGEKSAYHWTHLEPSCAVLHGSVLAVGTLSGDVFFYNLKCRKDILHLNPSSYVKCVNVDFDGIKQLAIKEAKDECSYPQLIASTGFKIFLISFKM